VAPEPSMLIGGRLGVVSVPSMFTGPDCSASGVVVRPWREKQIRKWLRIGRMGAETFFNWNGYLSSHATRNTPL
jgi:hypothetical protein